MAKEYSRPPTPLNFRISGSGSGSSSGPTAFVNISVRAFINCSPVPSPQSPVSGIQQLHHHHIPAKRFEDIFR
uniref:HDC03626 n=1 Tax=Drosophila melanogaster TaxID=7227 RepID=Q6IH20_DROME|nr:TPA_inf: HDC03626 [Drosophila melanogaster]